MFIIIELNDKSILKPEELSKEIPIDILLLNKIKSKYIGKVLSNKGIVVSVKSIILKNNTIIEHEGVITIDFSSEIIVFSPKKDEILYGKIESSTENGLIIDCCLCKVFIKKGFLPENSNFSVSDGLWHWRINSMVYYYDINQRVRLKVENVIYNSKSSSEFKVLEGKEKENNKLVTGNDIPSSSISSVNDYIIISGSFKQSGLGPLCWWKDLKKT